MSAKILDTLDDCGLSDDTIIMFTSDHGDMLGERGLWYKMSFMEHSARVPLIVYAPGRYDARRIAQPTSLLDIVPTLSDIAGRKDHACNAGRALTVAPA